LSSDLIKDIIERTHLQQMETKENCINNKFVQILAQNPVFHNRNKHTKSGISLSKQAYRQRYHFIRKSITRKQVKSRLKIKL